MIIIDGTDMILGRAGTFIAKKALLGEEIILFNTHKMVISGSKADVAKKYYEARNRGVHSKGPFYSRRPDYFVKRLLRGMFPHKTSRGREALSRLKCYKHLPKEYEGKEITRIDNADVSKIPNLKYTSIENICIHLGGRK